MPVHLCTYHVCSAWFKAIAQQVVKQADLQVGAVIRAIFKGLHAVMRHPGSDTLEGSQAAVRVAFKEFVSKWQHQPNVISYVEQEWWKNIGAFS